LDKRFGAGVILLKNIGPIY